MSHRRHMSRALDLLFPPRCAGCSRRGHWLCPACLSRIPRSESLCGRCLLPCSDLSQHYCQGPRTLGRIQPFGLYEGPLKEAIHQLKYRGRFAIAEPLAALLAPCLLSLTQQAPLLVPVPLHPRRLRERGYNQSEHLARALARQLGLEYAPTALQRLRDTPHQTTLTPQQRAQNMRAAFGGSTVHLAGRTVLLIDDVVTTGATLHACAEAAQRAGAQAVDAAVAAP